MSEASRLRSRLALYYKRRRKLYAQDFPEFFDADLRKLFVDAATAPENERAAAFLRRSRKMILNAVSTWTGEPKYTLSELLRALTDRCAELDLRLRAQSAGVEVTALRALATHHDFVLINDLANTPAARFSIALACQKLSEALR